MTNDVTIDILFEIDRFQLNEISYLLSNLTFVIPLEFVNLATTSAPLYPFLFKTLTLPAIYILLVSLK